MKDSGVEWLGEIPEEWKITKIKSIFYVVAGATPKSEQEGNFDGNVNITVRQSRQSGVARATCPD